MDLKENDSNYENEAPEEIFDYSSTDNKLEVDPDKNNKRKHQKQPNLLHVMNGALHEARDKLSGLRAMSRKIVDRENEELIKRAKRSYSNTLKESIKDEKTVFINIL